MKYLITLSYDGSKYNGLQKLKNSLTVQGELENVLTKLNTSFVKVTSSGRTDKKVHAINQKCTFSLSKNITPYKLKGYLNRSTSRYLYVHSCVEIENQSFHARFSVKSKTYKYIINTGPYDPIKEDYQYNLCHPLNTDFMKKASDLLLGTHNFRAFVVGKHQTYESTINFIDITEQPNQVIIHINGSAFYTYMVRNIVTILILIGSNKIDEALISRMINEQKKIIEYSPSPPGGLYLEDVLY